MAIIVLTRSTGTFCVRVPTILRVAIVLAVRRSINEERHRSFCSRSHSLLKDSVIENRIRVAVDRRR